MSSLIKTMRCLMTDAVESNYIGYWAEVQSVERDDDGYVTAIWLRDGGFEGDPEPAGFRIRITQGETSDPNAEGFYRLSETALYAMRNALVLGHTNFNLAHRIAACFSGPEEDWDYDSESADCLIQLAYFDKVIYG